MVRAVPILGAAGGKKHVDSLIKIACIFNKIISKNVIKMHYFGFSSALAQPGLKNQK